MDVRGARILVPGASGALGGALVGLLHGRGATVAVAGRDRAALDRLAAAHGGLPARQFDAYDLDACAGTVRWAAERLGGLDAVVVCVGVAAFGPADAVGDAVAEHLVTVNALAPIAFLRAALTVVPPGGVLAAVTGMVARTPVAGMADYSAAKAALSAWLSAVRRERRRSGVGVLEIRLPHLDTGFAGRAVAGRPGALPDGLPVERAVDAIVGALESGGRLVRSGDGGTLETVP
ncbi:SDR family NAD(P)-dependent oxidoreductase [Streptomyces tropicalis]|uniref:SDR family NAD(P)-dependent oxidoreductase n=1 Tax=Streptomyces tropicalis TaxID=3034234 RepID=A0ABT6AA09_9ACTN|nr:SDR family oxidoreductase [Streptomyces tropicalis]MDF3301483.1 SDR family NAD(P)-dependent oxidoreductase [Streptomyces tropicalis]